MFICGKSCYDSTRAHALRDAHLLPITHIPNNLSVHVPDRHMGLPLLPAVPSPHEYPNLLCRSSEDGVPVLGVIYGSMLVLAFFWTLI
jgi:hypothetical protein